MTKLDEIAARADAATKGPWSARTTGVRGGDHWYICDDVEAIAHISAQDGINEDQREPDAEFIAHAREDVPMLVAALRAVERLADDWERFGHQCLERYEHADLEPRECARQLRMAQEAARDSTKIRTAIWEAMGE